MPGTAIPSRPAPPPPPASAKSQRSIALPKPAPRLSKSGASSLRSVSLVTLGITKKPQDATSKRKPPPPRPPPPRVQLSSTLQPSLSLKESEHLQQSGDLLIDWSTPPGSPTTGRSSSDGLSLRSFGSDSSGGASKTGAGTTAPSESGFESEPEGYSESVSAGSLPKPFSMPTIIRPSRSKPLLGRAATSSTFPEVAAPSAQIQELINLDFSAPPSSLGDRPSFQLGSEDLDSSGYSPPEPNIPPPSLPSEYREEITTSNVIPQLGKAIALYTYESSEAGDLHFKEGTEIEIMRKVNDEWLFGSCNGREGMFPANFVQLLSTPSQNLLCKVVAKFSFQAETDGDLDLKEGDVIQVTSSHGNGWLFGFIGNRQGQFPESFVERLC